MWIFCPHDQHSRKPPGAKIEKEAGLGSDIFGLFAIDAAGVGLNLPQGDLTQMLAAALCEVVGNETRRGHRENIAHPIERRFGGRDLGFQHKPHDINPQDFGDLSPKIMQEFLELGRIHEFENGAVDLVGAGEVLVGCGDHRAVRIL